MAETTPSTSQQLRLAVDNLSAAQSDFVAALHSAAAVQSASSVVVVLEALRALEKRVAELEVLAAQLHVAVSTSTTQSLYAICIARIKRYLHARHVHA